MIPPKPNEFTPARRGPAPGGWNHGRVCGFTQNCASASSLRGSSQCNVGGSTLSRRARIVRNSEAMPAAGMAWPIIDLTEPRVLSAIGAVPQNVRIVSISTWSPTGVPVPCPSR